MKPQSKLILLIFLIVFFLLLLAAYIVFETQFNLIVKKIYLILSGVIFIVIVILFSLYKTNENKNFKKINDDLNKLLIYTDKLLKSYLNFYISTMDHLSVFYNREFEYKKKFSQEYSDANPDELCKLIDEMIENSEKIFSLFEELKNNENIESGKEKVLKMTIDFQYNSEIISNFIKSIIVSMNNSNKPLTEGIYLIKLKINNFLKNMSEWQKELSDKNSNKNFNSVIIKYSSQIENFNTSVAMINDYYNVLVNNLKETGNIISKIDKNTSIIQEISEVIRLLSINASIEATRAGAKGKGFKIVSDEVKKLSHSTQSIVNKIVPLIKSAKDIVTETLSNFNLNINRIVENVNLCKNEFTEFYEILTNYYNDLNSLFSSAEDTITHINDSIDSITPTFQLNNLSIQEMENLDKLMSSFLNENQDIMNTITSKLTNEQKNNFLNKIIENINKQITTESEIKVINKIAKKYGLKEYTIEKSDNFDLEIF